MPLHIWLSTVINLTRQATNDRPPHLAAFPWYLGDQLISVIEISPLRPLERILSAVQTLLEYQKSEESMDRVIYSALYKSCPTIQRVIQEQQDPYLNFAGVRKELRSDVIRETDGKINNNNLAIRSLHKNTWTIYLEWRNSWTFIYNC